MDYSGALLLLLLLLRRWWFEWWWCKLPGSSLLDHGSRGSGNICFAISGSGSSSGVFRREPLSQLLPPLESAVVCILVAFTTAIVAAVAVGVAVASTTAVVCPAALPRIARLLSFLLLMPPPLPPPSSLSLSLPLLSLSLPLLSLEELADSTVASAYDKRLAAS